MPERQINITVHEKPDAPCFVVRMALVEDGIERKFAWYPFPMDTQEEAAALCKALIKAGSDVVLAFLPDDEGGQ